MQAVTADWDAIDLWLSHAQGGMVLLHFENAEEALDSVDVGLVGCDRTLDALTASEISDAFSPALRAS